MTTPPTQLRLVVETEDFDAALAFYRDALGLPELGALEGGGGAPGHPHQLSFASGARSPTYSVVVWWLDAGAKGPSR